MRNFQPILKSIYENLDIPQPHRSKILLEISADMADMYEHLLIRGLTEEEAMDKLESEFNFEEDTLEQLKIIHTPAYSRWLENLPKHTQSYWEKGLITALAIFMMIIVLAVFSSGNFIENSSPMVFILFPFFAIGITLSAKKYYDIYLRRDHETGEIRRWMQTLLLMAAASLGTGLVGLINEIYSTFIAMAANIDQSLKFFVNLLLRSSAMLTVSIASFLIIAVLWFILIKKIQDIEISEASVLINNE